MAAILGPQLFVPDWLPFVYHELLLFTAIALLIGALDEFAVDLLWLWFRLTGRIAPLVEDRAALHGCALSGPVAVLIPTWREERVIGQTLARAMAAWPQQQVRFYVGHYRNDPQTAEAARAAGGADSRLRIVTTGHDGPTTKADCLNALYTALEGAERAAEHGPFHMIVLHDAEDLVDPAALPLMDRAMAGPERADFVQLPVLPLAQPGARWVGGHYVEEFAESHAKAMVVRDALGAALPAAGVGCAFARPILRTIASRRGGQPFAADSLTEDYELGMAIKGLGGRSRFLRVRGTDGRLIATRAAFPHRLGPAVRQKARWVHGIALQGWDRIGWPARAVDCWMLWRDRRGPMNALVLLLAYALPLPVLIGLADLWAASGAIPVLPGLLNERAMRVLLALNLVALGWRLALRFCFTAREYGAAEGARALLRVPLANLIAIMAGMRALHAYCGALRGRPLVWDKTAHDAYSAAALKG